MEPSGSMHFSAIRVCGACSRSARYRNASPHHQASSPDSPSMPIAKTSSKGCASPARHASAPQATQSNPPLRPTQLGALNVSPTRNFGASPAPRWEILAVAATNH